MEYVSPIDERVRDPEPLAARTTGLEGKTVALLDISKNRSAEFLDRLDHHLRSVGATTRRFRKPAFSRLDQVAGRGARERGLAEAPRRRTDRPQVVVEAIEKLGAAVLRDVEQRNRL